jgi:ABC-type polysaccharide/polyol phosphate export permease
MTFTKYHRTISLGYSIAKANFKLRNEGSYLGIFWYLLNPLSFFLVILFVYRALFSSQEIVYYPMYLFMGLIMINFFNQLISTSVKLIENNAGFIKSVKVPYETFVLAAVFQSVFSHAFELLIVAVLFLYFHLSLIGILWYLVVFVFFTLFTLGACLTVATLGAYLNDLGNIWAILSQLLFFASPVFYAVHPGTYLYLGNLLNPLFYFFTAARDVSIYATIPAWWMILILVAVSLCSMLIGMAIFNRFKGRFAEMV